MKSLVRVSSLDVSKLAMSKTDFHLNPNDVLSFLNFYTDGRPNKIFVPVIAFLEWKGIKVKSDANPYALPPKQWTFVYRELAAKKFNEDAEMVIKREANNYLLFDIEFLIALYDEARDEITNQILG